MFPPIEGCPIAEFGELVDGDIERHKPIRSIPDLNTFGVLWDPLICDLDVDDPWQLACVTPATSEPACMDRSASELLSSGV